MLLERWQSFGLCAGTDPNLWVVDEARGVRPEAWDELRAICAGCPVQTECLLDALENQDMGMRGGTTDAERARFLGKERLIPVGSWQKTWGWMVGVPTPEGAGFMYGEDAVA